MYVLSGPRHETEHMNVHIDDQTDREKTELNQAEHSQSDMSQECGHQEEARDNADKNNEPMQSAHDSGDITCKNKIQQQPGVTGEDNMTPTGEQHRNEKQKKEEPSGGESNKDKSSDARHGFGGKKYQPDRSVNSGLENKQAGNDSTKKGQLPSLGEKTYVQGVSQSMLTDQGEKENSRSHIEEEGTQGSQAGDVSDVAQKNESAQSKDEGRQGSQAGDVSDAAQKNKFAQSKDKGTQGIQAGDVSDAAQKNESAQSKEEAMEVDSDYDNVESDNTESKPEKDARNQTEHLLGQDGATGVSGGKKVTEPKVFGLGLSQEGKGSSVLKDGDALINKKQTDKNNKLVNSNDNPPTSGPALSTRSKTGQNQDAETQVSTEGQHSDENVMGKLEENISNISVKGAGDAKEKTSKEKSGTRIKDPKQTSVKGENANDAKIRHNSETCPAVQETSKVGIFLS